MDYTLQFSAPLKKTGDNALLSCLLFLGTLEDVTVNSATSTERHERHEAWPLRQHSLLERFLVLVELMEPAPREPGTCGHPHHSGKPYFLELARSGHLEEFLEVHRGYSYATYVHCRCECRFCLK